jgi:uncharacterized protein YegJ (DUF2314 family)
MKTNFKIFSLGIVLFISSSSVAIGQTKAPIDAAVTEKAQSNFDPETGVAQVNARDADMEEAKALGKKTLPEFLKRLDAPTKGEVDFAVKFDLDPTGPVEYIWAEELKRSGSGLRGKISNHPISDKFKQGQSVFIPLANIIDWNFNKDGVAQGHHTTKVIIKTLPPEVATKYRKILGWD